MNRLFCFLITTLFLTGCATADLDRLFGDSSGTSPDVDSYQQERQRLFNQPYIDPLTDYLIEHQGDPDRAENLAKVRQERDRRCHVVADEYADKPATDAILERYNVRYGYSCPQQVALFKERIKRDKEQKPKSQPTTEPSQPSPTNETVAPEERPAVSDQALSDCYLLTTIRNFSAARDACRVPAEKGDVQSQANMAQIAHAFEDYAEALQWAEKAAPGSGDASFLLGQMYASGQGVSENPDQALYWYREAAKQGHEQAQVILGRQNDDAPEGEL